MKKTDRKEYWKRLLTLFATFLKIGAFTFGGGYAMIPLVQREVSEKRRWITDGEILEIVAISESTPGPIAINSATFVGYRICGFLGAFACTLGVVLPSFLIILCVSKILGLVKDLRAVRYAFLGIRAGVLALILKALVKMYKACPKKMLSYIVMGVSFILAAVVKLNVIVVVIICAATGLFWTLAFGRRAKK